MNPCTGGRQTMSIDPLNKIEALFHEALALDPADRNAFLEAQCSGDPELQEEVKSLLAVHTETSPDDMSQQAWKRLLDSSDRHSELADLEPDPDLPFERLGEFRVIRRLGQGGMGVVYLGVQEPLQRLVALKVIRTERTGNLQAVTRFWREIDAVSGLNHPNIVTVYGSSEQADIRSFAMEYLPGSNLDELLHESTREGEKISNMKTVGWIREIAEALDCAHQAGVIHRDVKPSNIRITTQEQAKLMDFGIARHLALPTLTLTGEFHGTPHYASPEQVDAGKNRQIDFRTDIYSLGVTLYEAVTGRVPFVGESTDQVFKQILFGDPVPPRRLNPSIPRDLETVILKAMEKEPSHRYSTMTDFAEDLRRFQEGEVILAKPAGITKKIWKRVRKNPLVTTAVSVALISLLSLFSYVLWSYPQVLEEAEKARVVNEFLGKMLSSPDPAKEGKDVKVIDVLDKAVKEIETTFSDQPVIEASIRNTIGQTYRKLGQFAAAEAQLKIALEIRRNHLGEDHFDTLMTMNNMAITFYDQDRLAEAEQLHRRVVEIRRRIQGATHLETLMSMNNLAMALADQDNLTEAETILQEVVELHVRKYGNMSKDTHTSKNNLATLLHRREKYPEAEALLREVVEARLQMLKENHPDTLTSMDNLGSALRCQEKYEEAESLHRKVLEIRVRELPKDHVDTLLSMNNLAVVLAKMGKYSESEKLQRECLATRRRTLSEDHSDIVNALNNLATLLYSMGKPAEAEPFFREVMEIVQRSYPGNRRSRATFLINHGTCLMKLERFGEAEKQLLSGYKAYRSILGPAHWKTRDAGDKLVSVYKTIGKTEEAEAFEARLDSRE